VEVALNQVTLILILIIYFMNYLFKNVSVCIFYKLTIHVKVYVNQLVCQVAKQRAERLWG
jgi:hypothetical protein